ncbi:MAG TPA: hypothetical protein VLW75_12290 [Rhizomicrobium sp.]|nr:hypothetical protein [Rhizomicrobium sp.]
MAASIPMSRSDTDDVRQRSGWLIPIAVFVVTAGLSALFLLYYLAPAPTSLIEDRAVPTAVTDPVSLQVGKLSLVIPANYVMYRRARNGGKQEKIEIYATYPDFHGYTDSDAQTFAGNAADSPVVYMLVRKDGLNLSEQQKFQRIYLNYLANSQGASGPFGLTQYAFRDDSGYRGQDLFTGQGDHGQMVFICARFSMQVQSPNCWRDMRLAKGVSVSYRFKRANLSHWREIAAGVDQLMRSFVARAK